MKYIVFHKPLHVVSSRNDQRERIAVAKASKRKCKQKGSLKNEGDEEFIISRSIYDVAEEKGFDVKDLGLVGRLDAMTSGIMLFTDDSRLQSALLLPEDEDDGEMDKVDKDKNVTADADILRRYKTKVYTLDVLASPHHKLGTDWSEAKQMALIEEMSAPLSFTLAGIAYHTNPADVSIISRYRSEEHSHGGKGPVGSDLGWCMQLKVVLREGKHHQIRRIAARSKFIVRSLTRELRGGHVDY